jgi:hypothetical protein
MAKSENSPFGKLRVASNVVMVSLSNHQDRPCRKITMTAFACHPVMFIDKGKNYFLHFFFDTNEIILYFGYPIWTNKINA